MLRSPRFAFGSLMAITQDILFGGPNRVPPIHRKKKHHVGPLNGNLPSAGFKPLRLFEFFVRSRISGCTHGLEPTIAEYKKQVLYAVI